MLPDVQCPRCGRAYAAGRFELGRALQCACGATVAPETMARPEALARPLRFAADAMLGRLARWLRLLGFDTTYVPDIHDADLVRDAVAERRILLTRDRGLAREWRVGGIVLVKAEAPMAQLAELDGVFNLARDAALFTRCARCNTRIESVDDRVRRCPECRRLYWAGSHVRRILATLRTVLPHFRHA